MLPASPEHESRPGIGAGRHRLLDPAERFSEVSFGLIMVLTFTGSLSVATAGGEAVRTMMMGAIGCNLAWGVVDAVMYIIGVVSSRRRDRVLCRSLGASATPAAARAALAEALPEAVSDAMDDESLDRLRQRLAGAASPGAGPLVGWRDFAAAVAVGALVLLSTLPVVVPFVLVRDPATAIRVSNAVAIAMLFWSGWSLARYSGGRPLAMGAVMVAIGMGLVAMTIALGG